MPQSKAAGHAAKLRRVHRAWHILSIALITAGLVVIVDAGITLADREPISSIYGSIKQGEAADQLKEIEAGYPSAADRRVLNRGKSERQTIAALAAQFAARTKVGEPIGRIKAPSMDGLDIVVIQGTDEASLQKGPGHYTATPYPGQGGTVGIAGHRTTYLAPFRHIDSVEKGDRIALELPYADFTYEVQKTEIVDPGDRQVVRPVGYERLVLSACHPLYSAEQRYIVFARMIHERVNRTG
jgi:sortase A